MLPLGGDSKTDDRGQRLSTSKERYAAYARALASDNLDIDLDGAGWIMDRDDLGNVRLAVESGASKPVFVGIARTSDVSDYLRGYLVHVGDRRRLLAVPRVLPRP